MELDTKLAIVKNLADAEGLPFPDDVVQYVADRQVASSRELEGDVIRVIAYASLSNLPITRQLAAHVLSDESTRTGRRLFDQAVFDRWFKELTDEDFLIGYEDAAPGSTHGELRNCYLCDASVFPSPGYQLYVFTRRLDDEPQLQWCCGTCFVNAPYVMSLLRDGWSVQNKIRLASSAPVNDQPF